MSGASASALKRRRGVYAITPSGWGEERLLHACRRVLEAGVACLQLRDKPTPRVGVALLLRSLCAQYDTPLLINDDFLLANDLGVGLHVGRDDVSVAEARRQLGPDVVIGASVYDDIKRGHAAIRAGADYASFGRFFPSTTKPDAPAVELDVLRRAAKVMVTPVAAIGGVTADNGGQLVALGADLLCVVEGIFGETDPGAAVARLNALF